MAKHELQRFISTLHEALQKKTELDRERETPFFHRRGFIIEFFWRKTILWVEKGTSTCYGSIENSIECISFYKTLALCCLFVLLRNKFLKSFFHGFMLCWAAQRNFTMHSISFTISQNSFEAWKRNQKERSRKMKHKLRRIALCSLHSDCMWRVNDIREHKTAIYGQGTSI